MTAVRFPTATYRVHLTGDFTLHDAAELADHLADLGVDWLYSSPIQTVPAGATHGYHVLDPDRVHPEIGGEDGLAVLHTALQHHRLGMVLDIVPNHMGASPENRWWADVLAGGADSPFASYFDIDFASGPIVLPVLGELPQEAIESGALRVEDGALAYHDLRLPLRPGTDVGAPVEQVLEAQHYRLHEWRSGEQQLNWRRFFAVNELAGLRVEDPAVFDATHATILRWAEDDVVDGLRIDHVDGLADPTGYLQRLRRALGAGRWVVVEKITETGEELPVEWPVQGTTGYEVGAALQAWQIDLAGLAALQRAFAARTGIEGTAESALPGSKLAQLDALFPGEVARVVDELRAVPGAPDVAVLRDGVRHLTAHLAGYRTYAPPEGPVRTDDAAAITEAAAAAVGAGAPEAGTVAELLLADAGRPALLRWQQLTGPAAAKGFEDRLLFRHVALTALCEVGADARFVDAPPAPAEVAAALTRRAAIAPLAGTTTSTHDTKRSEDVRARLTALAEDPDGVSALLDDVERTLAAQADGADGIDGHARWLLLQAVLGSLGWEPDDLVDGVPTDAYRDRLQGYAQKALREAELRTSHRDPDEAYESAVTAWLDALLHPGPALAAVTAHLDRIAVAGAATALATVVLKVAAPGVPDVYRGCEVWDGSLTDPDNRRPLPVERIREARRSLDALLRAGGHRPVTGADPTRTTGDGGGDPADPIAEVRDRWRDGALKLLVTRQALRARRDRRAVFCSTACEVPTATGEAAEHVAAILRRAADTGPAGVADPTAHPPVLALATRLPLRLAARAGDPAGWPLGEAAWGDTRIAVGDARTATDLLTDRTVEVHDGHVRLADACAVLPTSLLELHL